MKKKAILWLFLMLLIANTANAEKYFVLDVNYILGSLTFNSINLREIDRSITYSYTSGFLIKLVSFENADLETIYYPMSENKNYLIYIPYNENAAKILVHNLQNSAVIDLDVSSFANTCGNNRCESYESYESCTKDCSSGSKDDFCDEKSDGICDPDCSLKRDSDCKENKIGETASASDSQINQPETQATEDLAQNNETKINYLWILLVSGIIVILLSFLLVKKIQKNKIINSLKQYINENIRKGFTEQQIKTTLLRSGYKEKEVEKAMKSI